MQGRTLRTLLSNARKAGKRSGLLLALLLVVTTLLESLQAGRPTQSASAAVPNANLQYGFTMALLQNNSAVRNMGFQWVEYTVGWDSAEPANGSYDWGNANNIVNYAQSAGVNVVIRVSRTPVWARDPSCASSDTCPPTDPALFGRFMGALAGHVRRDLRPTVRVAYELWNEPNVEFEWGGLCPNPERYTLLVRSAYPAIKAADASATVLAGAVTTVGTRHEGACAVDDVEFIQRMYAAGAAPYFDVLSDHPYGFGYTPEQDPSTVNGAELVFRRAERHRVVMEQYGDTAKQIWATEMGWAIDPATVGSSCTRPDWYFIYSPQQQADYLVRAFQWARSYWPWMGAMFVFNFDFNEAPWYEACHPFRFWAVRGRPAQQALASFVQAPPPTYTPVVDLPPSIGAVRYSSVGFNRSGGSLNIELDAVDNDNTAVDVVQAVLTDPFGGTQTYDFDLVAGTNRSGTWRIRNPITIPPNEGSGNLTYSVRPYVIEAFPQRRTTQAPTQQIIVTNTRFWDVPQDYWAYTYVEWLANSGVIAGYSDNSFRPGNNATRGQFSKMIVLTKHWNIDLTGAPHFTDVPPNDPFYQYVETAVNHSIISGYSDATFKPYNNITRSQIAKIIVLAQGWQQLSPSTPTFSDVPPSNPFYQYVETAVAHGIISGYSDNTFRPFNNATRAQISKMLYLAVNSTSVKSPPDVNTK